MKDNNFSKILIGFILATVIFSFISYFYLNKRAKYEGGTFPGGAVWILNKETGEMKSFIQNSKIKHYNFEKETIDKTELK